MSLHLLGASHRTAPIEQRELLAIGEAALAAAAAALAAEPGVSEGMVLSTCNRVEILIAAADAGPAPDLIAYLGRLTTRDLAPLRPHFYQHRDEAVVRHLFRVASSLDSLVVGEPQILGQLKQAYAAAQNANAIGPALGALLTRAFFVAKRVRTETAIASQPVSISHAAVDLARQIFGDLAGKTVVLVGAGTMGELAARYLMQNGAGRLLVANRTLARAQTVAAKYGGEAFALDGLPQLGETADVLISCSGAPGLLVTRADAQRFLGRRRQRPMLFLDLAVPRDIDPAIHQLENAFVYNVDDLEEVVSSNRDERRREAVAGEAIVEAEVAKFVSRRREREVVPTLRALQEQAEALRAAECARLRARLGALSPEQEAAVDALTRGLMRKWLHQPLIEIKAAATPAQRAAMLEAVHRLFALPADAAAEGANDALEGEAGEIP